MANSTIIDKMDTPNSTSKETLAIIDKMDTTNSNSSSEPKGRGGFAVGRGRDKPTSGKREHYRLYGRGAFVFRPKQVRQELISGKFAEIVDYTAALYLAAVLQYLTAELMEVSGQAAMENDKDTILSHHIERALMKDEDLSIAFPLVDDGKFGINVADSFDRMSLQ